MDCFPRKTERFAQVKECIFMLTGFLCSLLSLGFGIILTNSRYWRLWQFESKVVQFVYIGLWEAYYHLEYNISGSETKVLVHIPVNTTWTISPEFRCAQGLMLLATLMKAMVVIFSTAAIRVSIIQTPVPEIQVFCYKFCVLILVLSSFCTFLSVTWNHLVDFYGKTTLDFPPTFPVRKEALIKKHCTHVFPIGILTSAMSLFAVLMFLFEITSLKPQGNVYAQDASKSNQNA